MDDRPPTLASAVIIPNIQRPSTPPRRSPEATNGHSNALKRRALGPPESEGHTQNSFSGEDAYAKRVRLSSVLNEINNKPASDLDYSVRSSPAKQPPKHAAADPEADKKRGRRLFGSLLGTLSQSDNAPSAAQQRRVEVERRQREKLAAQQNHAGATLRERPGSKQRTAEELEALKHERAIKQEQWLAEERTFRHKEKEKVKEQKEQVERDIEEDLRAAERIKAEVDTQIQAAGEQEVIEGSKNQEHSGEHHEDAPDKEDKAMDALHDDGPEEPSCEEMSQNTDAATRVEADTEGSATKPNGEHDTKEDEDEDMVLNRDAEEDPVIY